MCTLFIELIQVSLDARDKLSRTPSEAEWAALFNESKKQAIVGVLINGIEKLPESQRPSRGVILRWIGISHIIETTYALQFERAKELTKLFSDAGNQSCLLKGLGFAQYYPIPARRQGGDIDLWVNGKREDIIKWLRSQCDVEHTVWHHVEAKFFDDVEIEIHFHPCWLYNPFYNNRLQKWFKREKDAQMIVNKELGFSCPTVHFNAVYSLVHFNHHLIEDGIGIRHIIDYYYILKSLHAQDKQCVVEELKRLGLLRLASAMMWALQEVSRMPDVYLICDPSETEGRFLLDEIIRGGNFGRYRNDKRRRNTAARMLALLPHYPSEVLWVVPWKVWHMGWRMFNK